MYIYNYFCGAETYQNKNDTGYEQMMCYTVQKEYEVNTKGKWEHSMSDDVYKCYTNGCWNMKQYMLKEKYIQKRTTNGSHHLLAIEKFNKDGLSVG